MDVDKFETIYSGLDKFPRTTLHTLAAMHEPVTISEVQKVLRAAEIPTDTGRCASHEAVSTAIDILWKAGLLQNLTTGRFVCKNPTTVLEYAVKDFESFEDIAHFIRRKRAWSYQEFGRIERDIRLAMLGVKIHELESLAEAYEEGSRNSQSRFLMSLCGSPFSRELFERLPGRLKVSALGEMLYVASLTMEAVDPEILESVSRTFASFTDEIDKVRLRHIMAEYLLFKGCPEEALGYLQATEHADDHLRGWAEFLRGDFKAAEEQFTASERFLRPGKTRKLSVLPGFAGVFYALTLFAAKSTKSTKTLEMYLRSVDDVNHDFNLTCAYGLVEAAVFLLNNDFNAAKRHLLDLKPFRDGFTATVKMLGHMVAFWAYGGIEEAMVLQLQKLYEKASVHGHKWIALEASGILARVSQDDSEKYRKAAADIAAESGLRSIIEFGHTSAPWERALESLEKLVKPALPVAPVIESQKRLIWAVQFHEASHGFQVEPWEQVRKGGRWSKGRLVSLERLVNGGYSGLMTSADRAIVGYAKSVNLGTYGKTNTYIPTDYNVVLALADHPYVVLSDDPDVLVVFTMAEIELVVEEKGDSDMLRLTRDVTDQKALVVPEGKNHFKVYKVTHDIKLLANILGTNGLEVPKRARARIPPLLEGLSSLVTIHAGLQSKLAGTHQVTATSVPYVILKPMGQGLKISIRVRPFGDGGHYHLPGQGGERLVTQIDGQTYETTRILGEELNKALLIVDRCAGLGKDLSWQWQITDPLTSLEIVATLDELVMNGEARVLWPEGQSIRFRAHVKEFHLRLRIHQDGAWFSAEGGIQIDDVNVLELDRLLDLLDASEGRFVALGKGEFLALTESFARRLRELAVGADSRRQGAIRLHPFSFGGIRDLLAAADTSSSDQSFHTHCLKLDEAMALEVPPPRLALDLRDYQIEGYKWLMRLAALGCGACLADDMGIGKTVQALAVLVERAPLGPQLVVAPVSVCHNWVAESRRFAPTLNLVYLEAGKIRKNLLEGVGPHDLVILSYGILVSDEEFLAEVSWATVVLDEAQAIKNADTQRARAACRLSSGFKIALTGTPLENHIGELWSLFEFLTPGLLGSMHRFYERFVIPIEQNKASQAKRHVKRLLRPFILRRTKSQVLDELPPRTEITIVVELSDQEAAFHAALRQRALAALKSSLTQDAPVSRTLVFTELMRLRRAACDPSMVLPDTQIEGAKKARFRELVDSIVEGGHKALVFSQFIDHLEIARKTLEDLKIPYQYLDGSTPSNERARRVERFQAGEGDIFLISLRAGGTGLNLTAADYVIHLDPWWNPAVEAQAEGRAHRFGQTRPVTIYRLISQGTVEEKILAMHARKRDLAEALLEGTGAIGKLTVADLMALIGDCTDDVILSSGESMEASLY